jgi:transcriptional regulator with XRE-family HTH domain
MAEAQSSYLELAQVLANIPLICRETRRARGLSLREAARQVGVSFSTLHRIESGEDCVASHLIGVMRWLDGTGKEPPLPTAEWLLSAGAAEGECP